MGQTQSSEFEFDDSSSWGSDIDRACCGRGAVCSDEWTPLSTPTTCNSEIFEMTDFISRKPSIITQQPLPSAILENQKNIDFLVIDLENEQRVVGNKMRKKKQKTKKKMFSKKSVPIAKFNNQITRLKKIKKKRIASDARYPEIPAPPPISQKIYFQKSNNRKKLNSRIVAPKRYKGKKMKPPEKFRYRGVKSLIH